MKKTKFIAVMFICFISISFTSNSQIISMTTAHWDFGSNLKPDEWLKIEQEYHEKVTMKNELILASSLLYHYYTADNSEVIFITVYKNLEDITAANKRSNELIEDAWPDEDARKTFFKQQSSAYTNMHSDELYHGLSNVKSMESPSDSSLIYYISKRKMASFPEDGSRDEIKDAMKSYFDNVIAKNDLIKAYYPMRHFYGSDSRDFIEIFVLNSLSDLEEMSKTNSKLAKSAWPNDDERKAFFKNMSKYFEPGHGDFIYRNEPKLQKVKSKQSDTKEPAESGDKSSKQKKNK